MEPIKFMEDLCNNVVRLCDPWYIYAVSKKNDTSGNLISLKLVVIVDDGLPTANEEKRLLVKIDTPIPVDFICYNISDWNDYAQEDFSFAYRVENGGERLYVKG